MKKRIEIWKDYRKKINKNMLLNESMFFFDEQIKNLHSNLLKAYPEYDQQFTKKTNNINFDLIKINNFKEVESNELEKILNYIKYNNSNNDINTKASEEINFSFGDIENIKKDLNKINNKESIHLKNNTVIKTKFMKLGEREGIIMKKIRIAIDGPSGSGKTTVARELSKRLDYKYISTGLFYRAIALYIIEQNIELNKTTNIIKSLLEINIKLLDNEEVFLNNKNVTNEVRSDQVSKVASKISSIPEVREWSKKTQIKYAELPGIIMDGRDTTFNIMPNAELKIFIDTSPEIRAKRRLQQNKELGFETNYENILKEIKERDYRDRNREVDPLHATKDSKIIDSTNLTIEQCVDLILDFVLEIIKN